MTRRYGIYLAYSPSVDLRREGLGRVLVEFLRAAVATDTRWTLACPSWMRAQLRSLLEDRGVDLDKIEILAPPREPLAVRLQRSRRLAGTRRWPRLGFGRALGGLTQRVARALARLERGVLAADRALPVLLLHLPAMALLTLAGLLLRGCEAAAQAGGRGAGRLARALGRRFSARRLYALVRPARESEFQQWYRDVREAELERLHALIDRRGDVRAWYCPTAFWPSFNAIAAPRLMCVPDIVLRDFPSGFAAISRNDALLPAFRDVLEAVRGGQHYVTYSQDMKWRVLVEGQGVAPGAVTVIPHGANRLDDLITITAAQDSAGATRAYCRGLLALALRKALPGAAVDPPLTSPDRRYLFFASQARPSKNLLTLLRAYRHLLRERLLGVGLILTCDPDSQPEVAAYVAEHRLERDVLFLHAISARELAACYALAELAVNPSLSEGGCPFTLTEALSVGTPVVMARIDVTLEVMTDPALRAMSLFDPYDWRAMADRIAWALANRAALLAAQRPLFDALARRSWGTVVAEHVAALEQVAAMSQGATP